jgi:hypothetical protein
MTERIGYMVIPIHPRLVTSDYCVHEVGVIVCGVQHVLGGWVQPGNQNALSFSFQWKFDESTSLKYFLATTDAIDRQEKIHACIWRFKVTSCNYAFNQLFWSCFAIIVVFFCNHCCYAATCIHYKCPLKIAFLLSMQACRLEGGS